MTLAKGLTAGYVPMGAVLISEEVYAAIADAAPAGAPIGHGETYSAHPVGAAVALEVIRLYTEGGILANGQNVARALRGRARRLARPSAGRRSALARHARCAGAGRATRRASAVSTRRSGLPDRLFAPAMTTASIFRAFSDAILGLAPALTFTEAEIDSSSCACVERSTTCWPLPRFAPLHATT